MKIWAWTWGELLKIVKNCKFVHGFGVKLFLVYLGAQVPIEFVHVLCLGTQKGQFLVHTPTNPFHHTKPMWIKLISLNMA